MAKKFSNNQIQGIVLLIAALLIYLPVPFIDGKIIGTIAVLVIGFWSLFK